MCEWGKMYIMSILRQVKNKTNRKNLLCAVLFIFVIFAGAFCFFGDTTLAAPGDTPAPGTTTAPVSLIIKDNFERILSPAVTQNMETGQLILTLENSDGSNIDSSYTVNWSVVGAPAATPDENAYVKIEPTGTQNIMCVVKAKSPGDVSIALVVTKDGNTVLNTFCNIRVNFAIDSSDVELFKKAQTTDMLPSLFMEQDQAEIKLESIFSKTDTSATRDDWRLNTQWTVDNEEVATVTRSGLNGGKIKPVAAGKTQVHASYQPSPGTTLTATMNVYVIPRVSKEQYGSMNVPPAQDSALFGSSDYQRNLTNVALKDGQDLYTSTLYTNQTEPIRSKVTWVITKDDGNGHQVKIADSLGMTSNLIELRPTGSYGNELEVHGIAGKYQINFYTAGTYDAELDITSSVYNVNKATVTENGQSRVIESGTLSYNPTFVNLTIKSGVEDKDETLSIGDNYNFAEAYHMTLQDFKDCFNIEFCMEEDLIGSASGAGASSDNSGQYKSYNNATAVLKALKQGVVVARLTVRSGKEDYIRQLLGGDVPNKNIVNGKMVFTTYLRILDRIMLDRSSITISVGQTYQLSVILNGIYNGKVVWESSDPRSVSVDNGLITGLRITQSNVIVSATLDAGDGMYRVATCSVKVEAAINSFTINPSADQTMLVGDHLVVKTSIQQTVSVAPLDWVSTDTSVFTVEPSADGKNGTITAVGGGRADLMVYNTVNKQYKVLHVTVKVAIDGLKFKNASLSLSQYTKGYNIYEDVSYTPNNATETGLTWASSNTSVLKVNKDGYISFVGPGTALVTVYPTFNPYNVMASCMVTVVGTPTSMTLSKSEVTMNVKESVTIDVAFLPANTSSNLTWRPNDKSIVSIAYDSKKQIATLTGLAPGTTDINITSSEGIVSNVKVTVRQPASAIAIQEKKVIVFSGQTVGVTLTMTPPNSTDTLVWESDDTAVATVDEKGQITGVAPGETYIFVTAYNGGAQTCFTRVAVTVYDAMQGIALPQEEYAMNEGESIIITPLLAPQTAHNQTINWTLSNSSVATTAPVRGSETEIEVTAIAGGSVMLTAETEEGGYRASCLIIVTPLPTATPEPTTPPEPTATPVKIPTKVVVKPATKFLKVGKSFYVKATVTGSTKNKKVKWTSSKKKVCTVTQSGKVKGKKIGTAYIKATAKDGSKASARCKVRVVRPISKLRIKPSETKVLIGGIRQLKAVVKPKNATIKKVKWSTKDAKIATVDSSGKVIGVAVGLVEIKAKAQDGSGKSARAYVTVQEAVEATGVTVENSNITLAKGKARQSGIVAAPANTTTSIRYYSDNKKVATVDSRGKIKTHKVGQATIYGETANGKIGYCDVLVVDLNRKGIVMRQYDTEQLRVNEISEGVTWYSKNINVASVDANGLVTGRKKGTTTVYAIVNGVKLGCRVKIKKIK